MVFLPHLHGLFLTFASAKKSCFRNKKSEENFASQPLLIFFRRDQAKRQKMQINALD